MGVINVFARQYQQHSVSLALNGDPNILYTPSSLTWEVAKGDSETTSNTLKIS